ncbi:unnamed protein product [Rhizopus stolonifer]
MIILQALLAIAFEAVIFTFHSREVNMISNLHIDVYQDEHLNTAFANARSLLVYFILLSLLNYLLLYLWWMLFTKEIQFN